MKIESRTVNGITILDVHGKITIGEDTAQLRKTVRDLLENNQKNIVINLGDVNHVDSMGLGELVSSYTTVTNQGGQLKLLNLNKRLRELLVITKLLTVFDTFDDETAAVASFS